MRYVVSAGEMKQYDENTIAGYKMPSLVLMERAALATAAEIMQRKPARDKVVILAGTGNNGGDGLAIGRLLMQQGYPVTFCVIGERDRCSDETTRQIEIIEKYGFPILRKMPDAEYNIIVDALFGIGLTREITGEYANLVAAVNRHKCEQDNILVCAVDIASGIHADTGAVMGGAIAADITVTFAFAKRGHYFFPGAEYTGELIIKDIGITSESFGSVGKPKFFTYDEPVMNLMPVRRRDGHKGSYGKVLLIAGSPGMSGACELSARGCFACGAGMVKIVTHDKNAVILQSKIPEAILTTYAASADIAAEDNHSWKQELLAAMEWADSIVIGPGLGKSAAALFMLHMVVEQGNLPLLIDADALNLLAENKKLQESLAAQYDRPVILTPHMGEFQRLKAGCADSADQETKDIVEEQKRVAIRMSCVLVCKGAKTLVHQGRQDGTYLNLSGNDGMAAAGSGDVLSGMAGAFLAGGMNAFNSACLAVYLHGLAGDYAAEWKGKYSMSAGDIADAIAGVLCRQKVGRKAALQKKAGNVYER